MQPQSDIDPDSFVTPAWVRKRLAISNSTLNQWIAKQHLPSPIRIGPRAVRFRFSEILKFEAAQQAHAVKPVQAHFADPCHD